MTRLLRTTIALLLIFGFTPTLASAAEPESDKPSPAKSDEAADASSGDDAAEAAKAAKAAKAAGAAKAAESAKTPIRVIQQRPFIRAGRLEVQLLGGLGVADTMFRHYLLVATPRVHITERWSVAATYAHYFVEEASLFKSVTDDFELFPEQAKTRFYAGAEASFIPVNGKFSLFDDLIVHFDMYLSFGGGITKTNRSGSFKPTGMIGLGIRFMVTKWLTINFELRDHLFVESYNAGDELVNNVVVQGGLSIFIPFGFKYRYPR